MRSKVRGFYGILRLVGIFWTEWRELSSAYPEPWSTYLLVPVTTIVAMSSPISCYRVASLVACVALIVPALLSGAFPAKDHDYNGHDDGDGKEMGHSPSKNRVNVGPSKRLSEEDVRRASQSRSFIVLGENVLDVLTNLPGDVVGEADRDNLVRAFKHMFRTFGRKKLEELQPAK